MHRNPELYSHTEIRLVCYIEDLGAIHDIAFSLEQIFWYVNRSWHC